MGGCPCLCELALQGVPRCWLRQSMPGIKNVIAAGRRHGTDSCRQVPHCVRAMAARASKCATHRARLGGLCMHALTSHTCRHHAGSTQYVRSAGRKEPSVHARTSAVFKLIACLRRPRGRLRQALAQNPTQDCTPHTPCPIWPAKLPSSPSLHRAHLAQSPRRAKALAPIEGCAERCQQGAPSTRHARLAALRPPAPSTKPSDRPTICFHGARCQADFRAFFAPIHACLCDQRSPTRELFRHFRVLGKTRVSGCLGLANGTFEPFPRHSQQNTGETVVWRR